MNITYDEIRKDLPSYELEKLFISAGWSDGLGDSHTTHFNAPFINSTLVISAWDNDCLVGAVRVLSDKIIRSNIYDLVVAPEYQGKGIGGELVRRCLAYFPNSKWLVGCNEDKISFYVKLGFQTNDKDDEGYLSIPSTYKGK